ncbi:MAG: C-terminal processing protease CtpA/Prc [Saprospiraceae bacterium]|jgi:C-terminal processing protease CtpA/Prc
MNKKNIKLPSTSSGQAIIMCIVLIFCQSTNLSAQNEKQISPKDLLKDFNNLEELFEAHPDPYTHISEKDFKTKFENVKSTLDHPHSRLEFYKKVAAIIALLKDGHSSVRFPENWFRTLRKKRGAFPYEVYLNNEDELFAIKNLNNGVMPIPSKILTINGISIDSFFKKIDPYISYEMKNFRNTIIDGDFEMYLYLAFGYTDATILTYFTSDTSTVEIKNMPYKEWKKFQKDNREEKEIKISKGEPYAYKKIDEGVGLISIYAFFAKDLTNYNLFLSKTFKNIKKDNIHSLIIDIRGNFGGWPKIASRLFHYISNSYFKTMGKSSMKISYAYRNNIFDRMPFLRNNNIFIPQRSHYIDIEAVTRDRIGSYVNEDVFFNEEPVTENFEFKGDCYLLTNRDSYSAASSFASTFQCYQMGIIIGEETGGTKIFRANAFYENLNKSGLRVSISTTKLFTTCYYQEFEGVQPTIKFTPDIFGITSDLDTQLLFAQRVIKNIQKKKATEVSK